MGYSSRSIRLFLVTVLLAAGGYAATAVAFAGAARARVDADRIYYGSPQTCDRPAVVEADRVYRRIPTYREVLDRKLTRDDPDYWPLMRKTSQVFLKALRKVCSKRGHDVVGEIRSITFDGGASVPEITGEVIKALDLPREDSKRGAAVRRTDG